MSCATLVGGISVIVSPNGLLIANPVFLLFIYTLRCSFTSHHNLRERGRGGGEKSLCFVEHTTPCDSSLYSSHPTSAFLKTFTLNILNISLSIRSGQPLFIRPQSALFVFPPCLRPAAGTCVVHTLSTRGATAEYVHRLPLLPINYSWPVRIPEVSLGRWARMAKGARGRGGGEGTGGCGLAVPSTERPRVPRQCPRHQQTKHTHTHRRLHPLPPRPRTLLINHPLSPDFGRDERHPRPSVN